MCDSKGKLGGKEVPLTFRTDPEFRKTPIGGRFDRQEIILASDRKDSFALRFVSADVRIENFWIKRDLGVFCVRRFGQRKIRPEQMPCDVTDVSDLVREHDDGRRALSDRTPLRSRNRRSCRRERLLDRRLSHKRMAYEPSPLAPAMECRAGQSPTCPARQ